MLIQLVINDNDSNLYVEKDWTINQLKHKIRSMHHVPVHQQQLVFNDIQLDDNKKSLLDYGVQDESEIVVYQLDEPTCVFVVDDKGFSYRFEFEQSSPIIDLLKERISEKISLPVQQIQLFFNGNELGGDAISYSHLFNHGVAHKSILFLKRLETQIPIQLMTSDGYSSTVLFWATETIRDLKEAIQKKYSIEESNQKLMFEGKRLVYGTLSYNGLKENSIVNVIPIETAVGAPQIFVKMLTGETLTFRISLNALISDLKWRIENYEGSPIDQQCLIYANLLEDGRTLASYKIQKGSIVVLVLRLRGC